MRIGVDTGGTFTDIVVFDDDGRLRVHKVRSSPADPSAAILRGLAEASVAAAAPAPSAPPTANAIPTGISLSPSPLPSTVIHGSTVATNAVLEGRGASVALIVTAGFEDVLRIGRQTRPALYDFMVPPRPELIPPERTYGLPERIAATGEVLDPLTDVALDALVAWLESVRPEAVAVCLLHAYTNPVHEIAVARRLAGLPYRVSCSHEVLPEYREYERASTTAINAYVTPVMARYLERLEGGLSAGRLLVMQSNGGSISAAAARATAVRTILSGPAGGVVGAGEVARAAGYPRVISFDMGGTSTDVSLIDGVPTLTTESTIADLPIRLPIVDIHTVGAGGGSIAHLDAGGSMRVGPDSAGADPGPACYGAGDEFTVTDANLLLGRLDPDAFLGGRMRLDVDRALSVGRRLAERAGLTITGLAEGVIRIANANMERAIRVVSLRRGADPRDYALLAFGGAGGMHACEIAAALDIRTVIVPRLAGVLSALGMLLADTRKDYSQTFLRRADEVTHAELQGAFDRLAERARIDMAAEGFVGDHLDLELSLDVRYVGQSYELTVPFTAGFREAFDNLHERLYGYADPRRAVEIVHLRVDAIGRAGKPALPRVVGAGGSTSADPVPTQPIARRDAIFGGRTLSTAVYHHEALNAGEVGSGPALITSDVATTVIPPGFDFRVDGFGNIIATRGAVGAAMAGGA